MSLKYPKVIYFCNKTIGKNDISSSNNWKKLNPDYEIKLYDDEMIKSFLLKEYGELYVDIFNYLKDGPIRADFFRICILYKNGGIYSDIDILPLVPLSDFIEKDVDFVTCTSFGHFNFIFNPNFIISTKNNIILKKCIDWYVYRYNNKKIYKYWRWSIMNAFTKNLHLPNYNKKYGIYYLDDMKIQIIEEQKGKNNYDDYNIYNDIRVFNNRQDSWDFKTHSFMKRGNIINSISIITHNTIGLLNDAKTCKKIFKKNGYKCDIIINEENKISDEQIKSNIVLFLERIVIIEGNKKIVKMFMPNHELFKNYYQFDLLHTINLVLCKTQIGYDFFNKIKNDKKLNYDIIYTKFTTYIPKTLRILRKDIKKDTNLFVMLSGTSPFKNTAYVIENWLSNDCYLELNPEIRLVVTCRNLCYSTMLEIFKDYMKYNSPAEIISGNDIIKFKNITLYTSLVPDDIYKELCQTASVAICPSAKEGYGHYINEARYFNTFVITINHPPMNELVDNKNGYLIDDFDKIDQNIKYTSYKLYTVYPNKNGLTEAIKYAIYNKNNKINPRRQFFKDLKYMKKVYDSNVIQKIKTLRPSTLLPSNKFVFKNIKKKIDLDDIKENNKSSIAIIVPYRDNIYQPRAEQLKQFIEYYHNFFDNLTIYIIEQSEDNKKFNRGVLLNIGYLIAKPNNHDMYVFHDVDLISPKELVKVYRMISDTPIHIASLWDKYKTPYFSGGITSFKGTTFEKINGFPTLFFGWGGEDNAVNNRMLVNEISLLSITTTKNITINELAHKNTAKIVELVNKEMRNNIFNDIKIWKKDGLNTTKYDIIQKYKTKYKNVNHYVVKIII